MTPCILIVGLGQTGLSIARYLKRKNEAFMVFDTREAPKGLAEFQAEFKDIPIVLAEADAIDFKNIQKIICSPGVPLDCALIQKATASNMHIESDIDCFAREVTAPVVAITGTNGKSTVTALVGEMVKASGLSVGVAGNIGTPVLDCLETQKSADIWVLELSSFQLEITHALKADAVAFLNLSDDHLDRHHNMAAYCAAKQRIYRGAKALVFNREDKWTDPHQAKHAADAIKISYGTDVPQTPEDWGLMQDEADAYWLVHGTQKILPVRDLKLQGMHNAQNALAALALADLMQLPRTACIEALKQFNGLPHRCETVRVLDDIQWINDSKGTNVGSTASAIQGIGPLLSGQLVLIAGGQGKGADFRYLREALKSHVRALILIGEDAALLEDALGDLAPVFRADSMQRAVSIAKAQAIPGDAVLLSPACASFDWFDNFNHRGDVFARLVEAL